MTSLAATISVLSQVFELDIMLTVGAKLRFEFAILIVIQKLLYRLNVALLLVVPTSEFGFRLTQNFGNVLMDVMNMITVRMCLETFHYRNLHHTISAIN